MTVREKLKKGLPVTGSWIQTGNTVAAEILAGKGFDFMVVDMEQVESWASMSNSNSAINPSAAVILKVKDGYAQDAAALLQTGYEQILSYSRMYNMDLQKVLQARLFVNGNYVALLILGAQGDWEASDEVQAKFAAEEAAKADEAWSGIFGSADNSITVPEDNGSNNGGFFDMGDDELPDGEIMIGG